MAQSYRPSPRRRDLMAGLTASLAVGSGTSARAQSFPTRPVRIVVPVPPGVSSIDLVGRTISGAMAEALGQPVVVENLPGAGGILAAEAVVRAPADGHTLYLGGVGSLVDAFLAAGRRPLDPLADLQPIARITRDHWLVAASNGLGATSIADLVALARAQPGALTYPSFGVGSPFHLAAIRFCRAVGISATHVPYRDSYLADLIAGRLSFVVQVSPPLQRLVAEGRLRGLAVLSASRLAVLPEVPPIAEAGHPELQYNLGVVLYAPAGTPALVMERLGAALNGALNLPAIRARLAEQGMEAVGGSPTDAARFVRWNLSANEQARAAMLADGS